MESSKSSSKQSSGMQKPIHTHSFMLSNNKYQQNEDERERCFMLLQKTHLSCFWKQQVDEILQAPDLKGKQELPLARVRRAIKSNNQVKMVSGHSTVLLAKASEVFILELTLRAWMQAEQVKRRTLQRYDIAKAIRSEELLNFLCGIVPLQSFKVGEEANYGQENEVHPAYQLVQPNNIPFQFQVEVGANGGLGNEFQPAYQMVQLDNIPYQFQVEKDTNDGQRSERHPAYQMVQPNNTPVEEEANRGQGNDIHPAYQMVRPDNVPVQYQFQVEEEANRGQGNEIHPAYQMVRPDNVPYQFQVEEEANRGQGNEIHPAYQMVRPDNVPVKEETKDGQGNEFHPAYQMVQPNNIPDSFISLQGIPAQLMLPSLFNSSAEAEFSINGTTPHKEERL